MTPALASHLPFLLLLALYGASSTLGDETDPMSVVYDSYERGQLVEARGMVIVYARGAASYCRGIRGDDAQSLKYRLAVSVAADHLANFLSLEAKRSADSSVPPELTEAFELILPALDEALGAAKRADLGDERVLQTVEYAERTKARLLREMAMALRRAGEQQKAVTLAESNASFLEAHGIDIHALLKAPVPALSGPLEEAPEPIPRSEAKQFDRLARWAWCAAGLGVAGAFVLVALKVLARHCRRRDSR
jgi:hypothetical protein